MYWICVSDAAVAEVAASIPTADTTGAHKPVVLHASGALSHDIMRPHRYCGSLHPLQSFPGPHIATPPMDGVPAAVAGDTEAVAAAQKLATGLGMAPFAVHGDRRIYHAAAVIAGNFSTVLIAQASRLLESAGVPAADAPRILGPLAMASIAQATMDQHTSPASALTGPFARGDSETVTGHLRALDDTEPELTELYRVIGKAAVRLLAKEQLIVAEQQQTMNQALDRHH